MADWWVENNSKSVRFRGEVCERGELEKAIAALTAQLPLLSQQDEKQLVERESAA